VKTSNLTYIFIVSSFFGGFTGLECEVLWRMHDTFFPSNAEVYVLIGPCIKELKKAEESSLLSE
jgi:hypothetical protein